MAFPDASIIHEVNQQWHQNGGWANREGSKRGRRGSCEWVEELKEGEISLFILGVTQNRTKSNAAFVMSDI